METTAYSWGCGASQATSSGVWPEANWSVATGSEYPFGTVLELSYRGIITRRIVHDRFKHDKQGRIDLFVSDCDRAKAWGRKKIMVREIRRPLGSKRKKGKR